MQGNRNFDVLIIGAGASGAAIARELARTDLKIGVIEKELDVCEGTSKANSGIVHAGYDAMPGTLKAKLNVQGAKLIPQLARELEFAYHNNGSFVLCFEQEQRPALQELYERGLANGVEGLQILEREKVLEMEPHLTSKVVCGLYAPSAGVVCPFGMTIALAENAADNGVEFIFGEAVSRLSKTRHGWLVNGKYEARYVINAAGLYADRIHNLTGAKEINLRPRKGEYFLLDKAVGTLAHATLFQQPSTKGKGVLVAPTVHGNLMIGPTADFIEDKEGVNTTAQGLEDVRRQASVTMEDIPFNKVITSFAGLRAVPADGDFIIEESLAGFIDVAGIESPGLTSAPAIGKMVADMVRNRLHPGENAHFNPRRKGFINVSELSKEEWRKLVMRDPEYGKVVCRCETITAGEIRDACRRSIPARSLDGVKRRVRAGMGRCQAGFCSPRTMEILAEETGIPFEQIRKSGEGSTLITGKDKEEANYA